MTATRMRLGRAVGTAVVLALLMSAYPTAAATAVPVTPVGRYRLTTTTVKSLLVVNSDHTFTITGATFNDSGLWDQLGTVVALGISTGPDGNCVFLGTLTATGISGKQNPGNFSCGGPSVFEVYAKRLPEKAGIGTLRGGPTLRGAIRSSAKAAAPPIDPTGDYSAVISGSATGFDVASGHTASWPDLGETGSWAEYKNVAAFVVTSFTADRGCIYVGKLHATAINTVKVPGPLACPAGVESTWYAQRLPG